MMPVATITNSEFLRELARGAPKGSSLWVNHFRGEPREDKPGYWGGEPYSPATMAARVDGWSDWNTYYCVAALKYDTDGELRRRKSHFVRMLALVVDDIELDDVQGAVSYVVQTSPGKHQVGIFIDANCTDAASAELCDAVLKTLVQRGAIHLDKSGNNVVRYVRLPVGQNQKPRATGPWAHQLVVWAPSVRLTLEDAAAAFSVDLAELKRQLKQDRGAALESRSGLQERQADKLHRDVPQILSGESYHESIIEMAASMVGVAKFAQTPPDPATEGAQQAFSVVQIDDLATADIKPTEFWWDGYMPAGVVTLLGAHGGTGKSTLGLMLAVCIATGQPLFGVPTRQGAVLYFSGEDPGDVVRYRLRWICQSMNVDPASLAGKLHILDATDGDPALYRELQVAGSKTGATTATFTLLEQYIEAHGIDVAMLDNASDTYDASEIDRARVRGFMRALSVLARPGRGMLLLAHIDKGTARGERSGSEGYSGSTAWHNSARSRMFLSRQKDGRLLLEHQKSNLGRMRDPLNLVWPEGGLLQADLPSTGMVAKIEQGNERKAVLRVIHELHQAGVSVSTYPVQAFKDLAPRPGFPAHIGTHRDLAPMLVGMRVDRLLVEEVHVNDDRKKRMRYALTDAGRDLIGADAPSAPSAPTEVFEGSAQSAQGGVRQARQPGARGCGGLAQGGLAQGVGADGLAQSIAAKASGDGPVPF